MPKSDTYTQSGTDTSKKKKKTSKSFRLLLNCIVELLNSLLMCFTVTQMQQWLSSVLVLHSNAEVASVLRYSTVKHNFHCPKIIHLQTTSVWIGVKTEPGLSNICYCLSVFYFFTSVFVILCVFIHSSWLFLTLSLPLCAVCGILSPSFMTFLKCRYSFLNQSTPFTLISCVCSKILDIF